MLIARLAIALMALHVIDDSFLQPQPGTGIGDHLVSGFVPLAGLAAAAWALPRLRPGARAALALLLGPLGIALGAEAIYYWGATGLAGDDYTGLLAIPAGVALLGVAAHTLWTSRKLGDRRAWRYPRRVLIGGAGLLAFLSTAGPLALSYGFTHITRAEVPKAEMAYQSVTLHTRDGLDLAGWYLPSRNGAAVIVYPGRKTAQKHARYLSAAGYGVLMVDRRGEGASEGDPHSFGWTFDDDIEAAVAFLATKVDAGRVGGLGLSVGGEMMLQTAAGDKRLAAVVSDGAGARVMSEELADVEWSEKLVSGTLFLVKTAAVAVFSNTIPPSDLTEYIPRIAPRPILLIHARKGEVDRKTPEYSPRPAGRWRTGRSPRAGTPPGSARCPRSTHVAWWASSTAPCGELAEAQGAAPMSRGGTRGRVCA